ATRIALDPGMSLLKTTVDADDDGYLDLLGGGTALAQRMGPGLQPVGAPVPLGLTNGPVQFVVGDFDGDGLPDIAGQSQAAGGVALLDVLGPFIDVGYAAPPGAVQLQVSGAPQPGAEATVLVQGPPAGTPVFLVAGLQPAHVTIAGLDVVPQPGAIVPLIAGAPLLTRWPPSLLPGSPLWLQALVAPPIGPAASQAIVVVP